VEEGAASLPELSHRRSVLWRAPLPHSYVNFVGRKLLRFILTVQGLGAFALITIGVMVSKFGAASRVVHPLVRAHLSRSGLRLLPMTMFVSVALGLVVIGQTVSLLQRVNTTRFLGTVMVTVVVRELGPLLTALIVLSRTGTANVIELGTARALGEVDALEALGIDPIHYLVVPRVIGMALGIFSLTVYLILGALLSGYLWAFLQDVPLRPGDYFTQLANSLRVLDFIALALKSSLFGAIIAVVTCYHGLAQPLRLEEVSGATIRAVAQSIILCMALDALFIVLYLTV
jgi:phospholipid/cholesterol/gamma-HCH transport system permease protein